MTEHPPPPTGKSFLRVLRRISNKVTINTGRRGVLSLTRHKMEAITGSAFLSSVDFATFVARRL